MFVKPHTNSPQELQKSIFHHGLIHEKSYELEMSRFSPISRRSGFLYRYTRFYNPAKPPSAATPFMSDESVQFNSQDIVYRPNVDEMAENLQQSIMRHVNQGLPLPPQCHTLMLHVLEDYRKQSVRIKNLQKILEGINEDAKNKREEADRKMRDDTYSPQTWGPQKMAANGMVLKSEYQSKSMCVLLLLQSANASKVLFANKVR